MFDLLNEGITGRAIKSNLMAVQTFNPRDFSKDKTKRVDDRPYGGGPGMVMSFEPLRDAITAAKATAVRKPTVVLLSPQGQKFRQSDVSSFLAKGSLLFVAGRYEGIDQRLIDAEIDEEWSIGDYVISGGELGAMVMIDAITRLIPGALGHEDSAAEDSLSAGLLKYPQYTRPDSIANTAVPPVLLSGHHEDIAKWRLKQSLGRTWLRRPDLLGQKRLTPQEVTLLMEFIVERKLAPKGSPKA